MSLLAGKTVVVSGVGAGLGHQVTAAVVRGGGNAVLGARTEANLAKSAAGIDPGGTRTAFRATDITDEGQCEALAAPARERFAGSTPWCGWPPGGCGGCGGVPRLGPGAGDHGSAVAGQRGRADALTQLVRPVWPFMLMNTDQQAEQFYSDLTLRLLVVFM